MAISAAELNIILSAKDKEFKKAMAANERRVQRFSKNSQKSLSKTSKAFGKLGGAAKGFLPALGVAAVLGAVKKVTSAMDEIGKKADAIGIGTDALQELRAAAVSAGVSQGGLDKSLEQFSKRLGEAVQGTGTAKIALEEMGLSAEDLAAMPLDKALGVFADKFALVEDATARTALITQVFGREGVAMINFLKGGSVEIDKSTKKMREMGVVIDEDLIRKAEKMQDRFDAASTVIGAQFSKVLGELMPLIVKVTEAGAALAKVIGDIGSASSNVSLAQTVTAIAGLDAKIEKIKASPRSKSVKENTINAILRDRLVLEQRINALRVENSERNPVKQNRGKKPLKGDRPLSPAQIAAAAEAALKREAALRAGNIAILEAYTQAVIDGETATVEMATETAERLVEIQEAYGGVRSSLDPLRDATLAYAESIRAVNAALAQGLISEEQAAIDQEKLTENFQAIKDEASGLTESLDVIGDSFATAFGDMISGTMSVEDAFKQMAGTIISELIKIQFQQMQTGGSSGSMIGGLLQAGGDLVGGLLGNAQGGPVQAGRPSVVGEHGRELFVPSVAGRILSVPQSKSALGGGGGVTVQQTINVSTGVQQTVRAEIQSMMPQIASASTKAVLNARRRGGSFAGAFA